MFFGLVIPAYPVADAVAQLPFACLRLGLYALRELGEPLTYSLARAGVQAVLADFGPASLQGRFLASIPDPSPLVTGW